MRFLASWTWLLLFPAAAWSQEPAPPSTTVTVSSTDSYHFTSHLHPGSSYGGDSRGEVSAWQTKLSLDVEHRDLDLAAGHGDIFRFNAAYEFNHYIWDRSTLSSDSGDTGFGHGIVGRIEGTYARVFDRDWTGLIVASATPAFEEDATVSDSVSYSAGVGALHTWYDEKGQPYLTFGVTLRGITRIEDSPWVLPIPYVDWKISRELHLRTEQKPGYGYALAYSLSADFDLDLRAYYSLRRFRLDGDTAPSEGIMQDERVSADLGVRYRTSSITAGVYIGYNALWKFQLEDEDGSDRAEAVGHPTPFLAFSLQWSL